MDTFVFSVLLGLLGAALGSFAAATVWRLRALQLRHDKRQKQPVNAKEYARLRPLIDRSIRQDHSLCLHCGRRLHWYDMIPVVSWIRLRGRCRDCQQPIGRFELLMELGTGVFFALSFLAWPLPLDGVLGSLALLAWLIAGVLMAILFAYDAKWSLLPDGISTALAVVGLGATIISALVTEDYLVTAWSAVGAIAALSGLYGFLYLVSRGRWVGLGDVKLGIGLALLLVDWQLALMALFLANLVGTLIVTPLLITKRLDRRAHIPFGPLMIAGTILAWFIGWPVYNWYVGILGL